MKSSSPSRIKWLNSTILGIGLASFFSDVGHEMATAAMPALLASLGAGSASLGIIEGLADGFSSFAKLISGFYADRLQHRKQLAVFGYLLTASGMASFAWASRTWHVLIGRVGGWVGRGARGPVRNVLLTEATTKETYGRAFGLERTMDSAGAVLGPAIALLLIGRIGLRPLFILTFVPGIMAAAFIGILVREKPHDPQPGSWFTANVATLPPAFKRFLLGVGVAGAGDFSNTFLILWASHAWASRFGIVRAGQLAMLFYVGYNILYTVSCYCSGILADYFPKRLVLAVGYATAAIPAFALLISGSSFLKFAVIFGFSGLYMGVWETVEGAAAAEMLPETNRGTGFGILATVNGFGDVISSVLVGILWSFSPAASMGYVVATSLLGAILIASNIPKA